MLSSVHHALDQGGDLFGNAYKIYSIHLSTIEHIMKYIILIALA